MVKRKLIMFNKEHGNTSARSRAWGGGLLDGLLVEPRDHHLAVAVQRLQERGSELPLYHPPDDADGGSS